MQLSLKYRPQVFADVVSQDVAVRILKNSVVLNRVSKAYLFSGIQGVGKTTLARIFAKALNCTDFKEDTCCCCASCQDAQRGAHPSILELDAASHNGVDDIRGLDDVLRQKPLHPYRILILDEAHMLTRQAQAAFLKTLEESSANNVFLLVTTDPDSLEPTVRSRCLSMPLRPLSPTAIAHSVRQVLAAEGRSYDESFINSLSLLGGGSLRDVQQILDRAMAVPGPLTAEALVEVCGVLSVEQYKDLASVLIYKDLKYALDTLETWYSQGVDLVLVFREGIPTLARDFLICLSGACDVYYHSGLTHEALARNLSLSLEDVRRIIQEWEVSCGMMETTNNPKAIFTAFFAKVFLT